MFILRVLYGVRDGLLHVVLSAGKVQHLIHTHGLADVFKSLGLCGMNKPAGLSETVSLAATLRVSAALLTSVELQGNC